jgi:hypothetical protein
LVHGNVKFYGFRPTALEKDVYRATLVMSESSVSKSKTIKRKIKSHMRKTQRHVPSLVEIPGIKSLGCPHRLDTDGVVGHVAI